MYTGHRIQKRTRTQSSSSTTEADLFQHRPLSNETDQNPADLENQETPDLQAQSERAARFGHNFGRVKVQDSTPGDIQFKLAIGAPGDKYEQEADSVAAQVMSMNAPTSQQPVQRQGTEPEEEEVQMKPLASTITPLVQRQEASEEQELQAKPLVQRQETAPEEEELQTKPLVQRQETAPEEEELQTKPLVQRQETAPEEEELQTKPLGQRQEAAPEEEELQTKPLVQRQEAPEEEELQAKLLVQRQEAPEEEELQAKPLVQRQEAPEEEELQAKPLVQRQEAAPEEEQLQAKPLVQRQETAPEEEQLQAKPLVQRQEAAPEEEELQAKPLVQRQEAAPEEEELQAKPLVQRQEAAPEEEQLQTKRSPDGNSHASNNLESQLGASKGSGSPLPDQVRSFMEPRFGADFSQVRVHTDSNAVQMNQALGAQAFTHGHDVYFGAGKSPAISDLTAHELTHVVQQTGAIQAAPGSGAAKKKEEAKKKKEEQEKKKLEEMKTILDASATGKEALKLMEDHKVAVKFKPGGGSYFDSSSNSMVIDSHETAANSALTFVHEMNHARYHHEGLSADVTSLSREDYVKKMVEEEAEGTVKSIEAKIELEGTKIDGSKASFPLEKEYRKAYKASIDAAKAKLPKRGLIGTMIDEARLLVAARIAGKERVIKGFMDGEVVTSNTKESYSKYYGKYWDKVNKNKTK
jgi:hypothetical protein